MDKVSGKVVRLGRKIGRKRKRDDGGSGGDDDDNCGDNSDVVVIIWLLLKRPYTRYLSSFRLHSPFQCV